jgi:hypothetical protein
MNLEDRKQELKILREAYRRLFRTEDGKTVLADLGGRFQGDGKVRPADGAPIDPLQLAMNAGARIPIRWITSMLEQEGDKP